MFTVVGAGFGIYGYLPALAAAFAEPVIVAREYQPKVASRAELASIAGRIRWADGIDEALDAASGVVLAVRPESQPELVARCCARPRLLRLLLEKPVAPNPAAAETVLREVERHGRRCRIGYTLLHTPWAKSLHWPAQGNATLDWHFTAHHFANGLHNWKREAALGGGVLRFFGIHVIALLAKAGYDRVAEARLGGESTAEPERFEAVFEGPGLAACRVRVDSRSAKTLFEIVAASPLVRLGDPFQEATAKDGQDRRVPVLVELLRSFDEDDARYIDLYHRTDELWAAVEKAAA